MPRFGSLLALLGPAAAFATIHTTTLPGRAVGGQGQRQLQSEVPSYEYIGCFSDQADEDRALEKGFLSPEMTHELCADYCTAEAYDFMGVQHGDECWCGSLGDEEEHIQYGDGKCNFPCKGNSSEICGGYWSFDLYFIGASGGVDDVSSEQQVVLDLHNEARCVHGADPLAWNSDIEETSRAHAEYLTAPENCGMLQNSDLEQHGYGENIFLCWGEPDCMLAPGVLESIYEQTVDPTDAVTEYGVHALRMLWKSTMDLGCSISSCTYDTIDVEILVCNYSPIGDYEDPATIEEEVEGPSKEREECIQTTNTTTPAPAADTPMTTPSPIVLQTPEPVMPVMPVAPTPEAPEPTPSPVAPVLPPMAPERTPAPVAPEPETTPAPVTPEPEPTAAPVTPEPEPETTPAPVTPEPGPEPEPEQPAPGVGACNPNPCDNGGSCEVDTAGLYTCSCPSGFAGMKCETDTSAYPEFFITVEFLGTWTDSRRAVFQSAADRWSQVLTHIPCTGTNGDGGAAGELKISATLEPIDGPSGTLGFAGPRGIWSDCRGISYSGEMTFDLDDMSLMEGQGTFEGVILHEMGHVIGTGTLWGECSECDSSGSAEWTCPLAAEVFNALEGNAPGSRADIVELDGGSGTRCGHFSETMFENELMTGFVNAGTMPLSKLTAASLADRGYAVNAAMCDDYIVPNKRAASAKEGETQTYELNDERMDGHYIEVSDSTGTIVETIESHRFRF